MSLIILNYTFSVTHEPPPANNQIRFNDSLYPNVTTIWLRNITRDGADMRIVLLNIPIGTDVYVQDENDSSTFARYTVTAAPIDLVDHVALPVTHVANGAGNLLNNQAVMAILIPEPAPVVTPPTGPALVAFSVAKDHLRISDDAHDQEITSKLAQASAAILDYLKDRGDPSWDAATAPLPVQAATLLLLADLYEHRGDDADEARAADLWHRIDLHLVRFRDPALA